jgi:predicted transcriptional regulator with HTH domain
MDLSDQATGLGEEVVTRRTEVDLLLGKVDRIFVIENQRSQMSRDFARQLDSSRLNISSVLKEISEKNSGEESVLTDGVVEMISSGRSTCSKLKESIQVSLSTLIGDASMAKSSMTSSCDKLDKHLHSTNSHIENTLLTLQTNLSTWLGQVDESLSIVQNNLEKQQSQIANAVSKMTDSFVEFQNLSEKYTASQLSLCDQSQKAATFLKENLARKLQVFQTEEKLRTEAAVCAMQERSKEIESALSSMLQNMVQESLSKYSESAKQLDAFTSEVSDISSTNISQIYSLTQQISASATEQSDTLENSFDQNKIEQMSNFTTIDNMR